MSLQLIPLRRLQLQLLLLLFYFILDLAVECFWQFPPQSHSYQRDYYENYHYF